MCDSIWLTYTKFCINYRTGQQIAEATEGNALATIGAIMGPLILLALFIRFLGPKR